MKKKLILLCLGVFLLCGCEAKNETTLTINEDKSMNLEVIVGYDDELLDAMISMSESDDFIDTSLDEEDENLSDDLTDETLDDETTDDSSETEEYTDEQRREYLNNEFNFNDLDKTELEARGFTLEEYQDDKYMGYILTKKIDNIDNLVGTPDFNLDDITDIDSKKIFTKENGVYKGKILFDDSSEDSTATDTSQYGINIIYNFVLNLPNESISNNATTVSEDGKTLTWNLMSGSSSTIEFEFEYPSLLSFLKNNMLVIAVIVIVIVILITLILKKSKSKKNSNSLNDVTKTNASEPVMQKNDNVTAIDPTQINQIPQTPIQDVNNQPVNQDTMTETQNQEILQQPILQPENSTVQPSVEQQIPTVSPEQITNPVNPTPTVQPNMENVIPQPEITEQNSVQPIPQDNNQIPEIKPIVPEQINVQPITQENVQSFQQQMINQQPNIPPVSNEVQQNNMVQPENQNINNQQGI